MGWGLQHRMFICPLDFFVLEPGTCLCLEEGGAAESSFVQHSLYHINLLTLCVCGCLRVGVGVGVCDCVSLAVSLFDIVFDIWKFRDVEGY